MFFFFKSPGMTALCKYPSQGIFQEMNGRIISTEKPDGSSRIARTDDYLAKQKLIELS